MRIIICGAGEVGSHAAEVLDGKGHSIVVIDAHAERLGAIEDRLDASTLVGNCAHADTLLEAGAEGADLLVAATDNDEVNLLSASIARRLGALKTIARVHDYSYLAQRSIDYKRSLGIDRLICPEFSTATAIAQALRNPAALAVENFAGGQVEMQQFRVTAGAKAIGQNLSGLSLPSGARVAAVTRGRDVMIPDATTTIEEKDAIFMVANADVFDAAHRLFVGKSPPRQKVVIHGGTTLAEWVCRFLRGRNFAVRVFERDPERAERLAAQLDWVTVLNEDPTDAAVFQEERIGEVDDFVSLLDDDEDNIIGAVLAKSRGVNQVISIVQRSHYLDLLYDIGVDRAFSPRIVASHEIEETLDGSRVRRLSSLERGVLDIWRVRPGDSSELLNKRLRTIKLTPNWSVVAIQRGSETTVPVADDMIESGDVVLVLGRHDKEPELRELFDAR
jgi:trk system potassium uptake protein TrkA